MPHLYKPRQVHHSWTGDARDCKKKAARILTVSEFSGREMSAAYGIDPKKIAITYCGIDHELYRPISDTAAIETRLRRYQISNAVFCKHRTHRGKEKYSYAHQRVYAIQKYDKVLVIRIVLS